MEAKILNSGSDGNSTIVLDSNGNTIILDCGLKYENIIFNLDISKIDCLLVSHIHKDHSKGLKEFEKFSIDTYTSESVTDGELIDTPHWKILPILLSHNVKCFGFLIYSKIDRKKILYMTDTNYIPKHIETKDVSLFIIDCNYSKEILEHCENSGLKVNLACKNHLAIEDIAEWLSSLPNKAPKFVAFHISNSGLNNISLIEKKLSNLVEELILSKPNTEIYF